MRVGEEFVSYVVQTVLKERATELQVLERDLTRLQNIQPPFPKITYTEAVDLLHENGFPDFKWGDDFGAPHEAAIGDHFDRPVFVHHYPTEMKAFYMALEPSDPRVCLSADLLAPEGYGEIIGGGERTADLAYLESQIVKHKLPREAYEWYLDLRRYGSVPHCGFGLGVERTVAWICKLDHVRETIPFPRMLEKIYP
jgi:asparaginyl-tRNA synthetase